MSKTSLKQRVRTTNGEGGRDLFIQLLRNYPGGSISVVDRRYRFVFVGGDLHFLLEADPRELMGGEMFPLLPEELRKIIRNIVKNVFKGATVAGFELPLPVQGHYYVLDALPLTTADGAISKVGIIIRDISSLKKVEQEVRQSLQKERELNELKSRFVTMASHEFRTPLTAILSSAQVLKGYARTANINLDRHIQCITSSVSALNELLDDFLSVQKMEEGKVRHAPRHFDLRDMVTAAIAVLEATSKRNTHIAYTHNGDDMVFLDPSLLSQIVMNLLSNAIKFSPEGAAIEVTTAVGAEGVELSVTDHGIGIPDEYRPHAFERFHRGANAVNIQGTGLGLHIAKTYATMMNGVIDYTSQAGKGTQFLVRFTSTHEQGGAAQKGGAVDRAA